MIPCSRGDRPHTTSIYILVRKKHPIWQICNILRFRSSQPGPFKQVAKEAISQKKAPFTGNVNGASQRCGTTVCTGLQSCKGLKQSWLVCILKRDIFFLIEALDTFHRRHIRTIPRLIFQSNEELEKNNRFRMETS